MDQVGILTGVNIEPFYLMEDYGNELQNLEYLLEKIESDTEKGELLENLNTTRELISGNVDLILQTICSLISKLSVLSNLPEKLNDYGFDSLNNKVYFSNFNNNIVEPIEDNFGRDLNNFKRSVIYAKDNGATTIFFNYS